MTQVQTSSKQNESIEVYTPYEMLNNIQRAYVDWKALGGIVTEDDGTTRKLTLDELGEMLDCHRTTFQKAKESIPNFWDLVADRRKYFNSTSRLAAMHDAWYVHARSMKNWQLTEAWLRNHDDSYKEAKTKVELGATNTILDVLENARAANNRTAIEGEVVDASQDQ